MVSVIKKLLPEAIVLNPKIDTPTLAIRNYIIVDYHINLDGKEVIFEYNGAQHYRPVLFGGSILEANNAYKEQFKRDIWLREYCRLNNIILIEIDGRLITGRNIQFYLINEFKKYHLIKN